MHLILVKKEYLQQSSILNKQVMRLLYQIDLIYHLIKSFLLYQSLFQMHEKIIWFNFHNSLIRE